MNFFTSQSISESNNTHNANLLCIVQAFHGSLSLSFRFSSAFSYVFLHYQTSLQDLISRFATTNTKDAEGQIKHLFLSEFGTMFTALDAPLSVLVIYLFFANSFLLYVLHGVEVVVDYEALNVAQDEKIITRCAMASNGISPA
jgi:hypothetical protein